MAPRNSFLVVFSVVALALGAACSDVTTVSDEPAVTTTDSTIDSTTDSTTAPTGSSEASVATTTEPATVEPADVTGVLDQVRERYPAPGALALVRRGGRETFGSSGTADLDGTPITPATRFRIASITKPIVSALVLDAVQRGELALDDVVGDLLPGAIRPDPPITVRMLLDHTSGVFDEGNEGDPIADVAKLDDESLRQEADDLVAAYTADGSGIASARLVVALAETHPRYGAPGTVFHYSNPNYQLAGMVLEAVTGRPLDALLAERLAEPLGLERTTITPPDLTSPELRGYGTSIDDGSLVDITDDLLAFGNGGNGGIMATAGDLMTAMRAIVSGQIVQGELLDDMLTPSAAADRAGATYGLGIGRYRLSCGTFYGHEGAVNGTASIAMSTPDGDRAVVIALDLRDGTDPRLPAIADELVC